MDDLELQLDTHRIPDGSRRLLIGRPTEGLAAIEAPRDIACYMARHARAYGETPPPGCHDTIQVGSHCLRHTMPPGANPIPTVTYYCPPCSIREWHWWNVTEATS